MKNNFIIIGLVHDYFLIDHVCTFDIRFFFERLKQTRPQLNDIIIDINRPTWLMSQTTSLFHQCRFCFSPDKLHNNRFTWLPLAGRRWHTVIALLQISTPVPFTTSTTCWYISSPVCSSTPNILTFSLRPYCSLASDKNKIESLVSCSFESPWASFRNFSTSVKAQ